MARPWMSFLDIVSDTLTRLGDVGGKGIVFETVALWASEACRDFAARSVAGSETVSQPLVPGQYLYRLPSGCISVSRVRIRYPGRLADKELPYRDQYFVLDDHAQTVQGEPQQWYLSEAKDFIGLYMVPSLGGFDGSAASNGNAGGTTVVLPSTASSVDDFYLDQSLLILDGACQGEQRTISGYVGSTRTATVSSAFAAQIVSGVRLQVGPDQLIIDYTVAGNDYRVVDKATSIATTPAPSRTQIAAVMPQRPINYWVGWEVYFKTGSLRGEVSRVISSKSLAGTAGTTVLELWPELVSTPQIQVVGPPTDIAADTFELRSVPNIPDAFHHYLVDYCMSIGLGMTGNAMASQYGQRYERSIDEGMIADDPDQDGEFEGVREYSKGEEEYEDGW